MSDRYAKFDYSKLIPWAPRLAREWPLFERVFGSAPSRRLLDLGAGTGEHARFLASKGFDVTGIDSSPAMISKSRAAEEASGVRFVEGDIRDAAAAVEGTFGGAICVGNVLPHLSGEADLERLATSLRRVLAEGAPVVFQLINYDRIDAKKERALPLTFLPDPDDPGATIIFLRTMEMHPDGSVTFMPTTLRQRSDREEPVEVVATQRVEIRGWRKRDLESALRSAGFASIEWLGAYDGAAFDPVESRDLIAIAK